MTYPVVVRGLDGKTYPSTPWSTNDRRQIVAFVHRRRHRYGESVRQIVAALADHGVRRSVGSVHGDLNDWVCPGCSGEALDPPEQLAANFDQGDNHART